MPASVRAGESAMPLWQELHATANVAKRGRLWLAAMRACMLEPHATLTRMTSFSEGSTKVSSGRM